MNRVFASSSRVEVAGSCRKRYAFTHTKPGSPPLAPPKVRAIFHSNSGHFAELPLWINEGMEGAHSRPGLAEILRSLGNGPPVNKPELPLKMSVPRPKRKSSETKRSLRRPSRLHRRTAALGRCAARIRIHPQIHGSPIPSSPFERGLYPGRPDQGGGCVKFSRWIVGS